MHVGEDRSHVHFLVHARESPGRGRASRSALDPSCPLDDPLVAGSGGSEPDEPLGGKLPCAQSRGVRATHASCAAGGAPPGWAA
ncbi:MAG: hypothetical protein L0206_19140, partial [Actinobacteria bacterium]|nr:hypothetical protein [Actinomycetota bacterium]